MPYKYALKSASRPHLPLHPLPPIWAFFWKLNMTKKFQLARIFCLCSLQKKSNLRCAIPVCATSKISCQKAKFITCEVQTLNTADLDARLSFEILPLLTLGMYVKPLAHLRHLTRQADTHPNPHPLHATEQYLNKF